MSRFFKNFFASLALIVLCLSLSFGIAKPAKAQIVADLITEVETTLSLVGDVAGTIWDKAWAVIKSSAAVAYKGALAGILNTLASETAKAIASGDWNAPVFSFKKGFYQALADAAVGDLLSTFVQTSTGIDLCNYSPDFTLNLVLPLLKLNDPNYKYAPKCTVSGMAANLQRIDLKKSVRVGVTFQTYSIEDFASGFGAFNNNFFTNTIFHRSFSSLRNKYANKGASPLMKDLNADIEAILAYKKKAVDNLPAETDQEKAGKTLLESKDGLEAIRKSYICGFAADLQQDNLALIQNGTMSVCQGTKYAGNFDNNQMETWGKGKSWVSKDTAFNEINNDIKNGSNSNSKDPISASFADSLRAMEYPFNLCYNALNRALNVGILNVEKIPDGAAVPIGKETGLLQKGSNWTRTIYVEAPNINGTGANRAFVTYQQGAGLNAKEFAACQVAFNSFELFNYSNTEKYPPITRGNSGLETYYEPGVRLADDTKIGDWAMMFNPTYVSYNTPGGGVDDAPHMVDRFIAETVFAQVSGDTSAKGKRQYVLDKINNVTAAILGIHETFTQMINNMNLLFSPLPTNTTQQMTVDEKLKDQQIALENCSANPLCAQKQVADAATAASAKKYEAENSFAQEKGTLLNPETTAVSEQAKNVPEVHQNELSKAQSGQAPSFTEYTGEIFADASSLFLATLFNELLRNGYKSLNNRFLQPNGLSLPSDLQSQIDAKNESSLAGFQEGQETKCTAQDINIVQAWVNIRKSFKNISQTGSGAIEGLSQDCKNEMAAEAKVYNIAPNSVEEADRLTQRTLGAQTSQDNFKKAVAGGFTGLGLAKGINNVLQDGANSSVTSSPVLTIMDNSKLSQVNFNVQTNLDLLNEMSLCPVGAVNHSIYQCTINPSIKDAIVQKMTIRTAIEKGLLSGHAILGIDGAGQLPDVTTGFTIAATQALRKTRIMPIGFEFAARLKVACYQKKTFPLGQGDYESKQPHAVYPWIGEECDFKTGDPAKEAIYRDLVLNATLQDILDGYGQTGTLNEVCGNFNVVTDSVTNQPRVTMSPFCGLVNPDWVLSMPAPKCAIGQEYSDILTSNKGTDRLQYCTELQSEVTPNNYGYCLKEKNTWDINGTSCPAQYSTCTTLIFNDGSIGNFNKDSLVGEGLCNNKNAGCTWVSTVKANGDWQDTINKKNQDDCLTSGGVWNGESCSNARLYLTGNVASCAPDQAGCSAVYGFKATGNNLLFDGGFENSAILTAPTPWTARTQFSTVDENACLADKGTVSNICAIHFPSTKADSCLSQGGTVERDGTCTLTLNNAVENQCGYCAFSGADANQDRSAQVYNSADCAALGALYSWKSGGTDSQFTSTCQNAAVIDCTAAGNGQCPIMVVGKSDSRTADASASEGTHSMQIALDTDNTADSIVIDYPIKLLNDSSTMILAGDAFSASFDISSANINIPSAVSASLIKTFNGGKVDSKTATINVDGLNNFVNITLSLNTLTDGTDLTLRLIVPHFAPASPEPKLFIDAVKIEYNSPSQVLSGGQLASSYSSYESNTPFAVKLPPEYLQCRGFSTATPAPIIPSIKDSQVCFRDGYYWDDAHYYGATPACYVGAPDSADCGKYARICRADEAGCQLYKPAVTGASVPGVVGQDNYCPTECIGYSAYKQQATYFEPISAVSLNYFIPTTASQCKAESVGCDQFTNISLASAGTAPVEYYSSLKQCIVPNTGKGEAGYFIWQGSAGGPPQLRTFTLQASGGTCLNSANVEVAEYANDPLDCKADVRGLKFVYDGTHGPAVSAGGICTNNPLYNGSPDGCVAHAGTYVYGGGYCQESDLGNDLDCLKIFDKTGNFFFRRMSYTVEASSSCKILRKTASEQNTCNATNGRWDDSAKACFYDALPSGSKQCTAQVSGCRAYTGSTGSNNFNAIFDTFETTGDTLWRYSGPQSQPLTQPTISSESITTLGHSLYVDTKTTGQNTISKPVSIISGKSYLLTFWAKHNDVQPISVGARFTTARAGKEFVTTDSNRAIVDDTWRQFSFGPILADWTTVDNNALEFSGVNNVFLDNVTLQVLQDSVYVIKNSWKTPLSCDQTNLGLPLPQAQLGCQLYSNTDAQNVALKSFTKLCRESSIGCQLVFDTKNSSSPLSQSFNTGNTSILDDITVPDDSLRAVVVDKNSSCQLQFAGCQAVGYPANSATGAVSYLPDIYVINNVNQYNDPVKPILCKDEELGCKEVKDTKSNTQYLKIENNNTCTYQSQVTVPHVDSLNRQASVSINGWFRDGLQGVGCAATIDDQQNCKGGDKAWNSEFNTCTTSLPSLSYKSCSGFSATYKKSLENSCVSDYKGSWYDNAASGACGCAHYPYDYYKAIEFPEHPVAAAICAQAYDQCTEFTDFNPNYINNGDFENINDLDNTPAGWSLQKASAGQLSANYDQKSSGRSSLQLIKKTERDAPLGRDATGAGTLEATQSFVTQRLGRLEKGKTYTVDFRFNADSTMVGRAGKNDDPLNSFCGIPNAAVEVVPYYPPNMIDKVSFVANQYVNKNDFKVFEPTGQFREINYSFLVPEVPTYSTLVSSEFACQNAGGFWRTVEKNGPARCYVADPNQPTSDYEVRIFGPLNGTCLNTSTGEKSYLNFTYDANGNPTSVTPYNRNSCQAKGTSWQWRGNCPDSSYVIDDFQISLAQDHQYYFIDDASLDKGTCSDANWDNGCISFNNVLQNQQQLLKVKADRMCEEWLTCTDRDTTTNRCLNWTSCREQNGATCVRPGSTNDPLRYNTDQNLLTNIDIDSYRKRYGISEEFRINRWRAGDYSGYTIPNLPPIEQMFDRVPGETQLVTAVQTAKLLPLKDTNKRLSLTEDICRGYAEVNSPFSEILKNVVPGFESVNTLVKFLTGGDIHSQAVAADDRLSICNYVKYTNDSLPIYVATGPVNSGDAPIGEPPGILFDKDKQPVKPLTACTPTAENTATCISTTDPKFKRQEFRGDIGACIEPAMGFRVQGGIVGDLVNGIGGKDHPEQINNVNGATACMTYFPL